MDCLPSEKDGIEDPYFTLYREGTLPLISLLCNCTACTFSLQYRINNLEPFYINEQNHYPLIPCQKISKLETFDVEILCNVILNVELTASNLYDWQYDPFTLYEESLMYFACSTHYPIAQFSNEEITYLQFFFNQPPLDVVGTNFHRYVFDTVDELADESLNDEEERESKSPDTITISESVNIKDELEDLQQVVLGQEKEQIITVSDDQVTSAVNSVTEYCANVNNNEFVRNVNFVRFKRKFSGIECATLRSIIFLLYLTSFIAARIRVREVTPQANIRSVISTISLRAYSCYRAKIKLCFSL